MCTPKPRAAVCDAWTGVVSIWVTGHKKNRLYTMGKRAMDLWPGASEASLTQLWERKYDSLAHPRLGEVFIILKLHCPSKIKVCNENGVTGCTLLTPLKYINFLTSWVGYFSNIRATLRFCPCSFCPCLIPHTVTSLRFQCLSQIKERLSWDRDKPSGDRAASLPCTRREPSWASHALQ